MIRIKDQSGNIVPGLYKNELGAIVVNNNAEYQRYMQAKHQVEAINKINEDIDRQEQAINIIMSEMNEVKRILLSMIEKNSIKG